MNHTCKQCRQEFIVSQADMEFYHSISPTFDGKTFSLPPPTLCPPCRSQRRLAFRNERCLYHRKCDLSGKEFISTYSPDKPYTVYESTEWWSDIWDPLEYGKDFDFSRPFFEQLRELWQTVPMLGLNVIGNEDCGYVSYCGFSKRCYLSYNTDFSENVYYSSNCVKCKDSSDLLESQNMELAYNTTDSSNCYNVRYMRQCSHCNDCDFLIDCKNCSNCFGCIGLRNKKYCWFNEQLTKEEFEKRRAQTNTGSHQEVVHIHEQLQALYLKTPKLFMIGSNNENVSGNYITNSKNAFHCFDIEKCEEVKYCNTLDNTHHSYDCDHTGHSASFCNETSSFGDRINNALFCHNIWSGGTNIIYCVLGSGIQDCFACIGLRKKQYCVFNKQYTKEAYEKIVARIIEHMIQTKEWGQFFPLSVSPFAYNETIAQDHFPRTKETVQDLKSSWKPDDTMNRYQGEKVMVPDHIQDVPENITQQILECENCKKNYRLTDQEMKFYRANAIPAPKTCPNCRYLKRFNSRNPRTLWNRTCIKCSSPITTTYSPDRPEIVYCEKCYLETVY